MSSSPAVLRSSFVAGSTSSFAGRCAPSLRGCTPRARCTGGATRQVTTCAAKGALPQLSRV